MDINNLVVMANRIGDFFESMPNQQEAKTNIANHIRKFWEPRMRQALISNLDHPLSEALHSLVREAISENKQNLLPK
jgi:formate dehydrogenase subunit delta